MRGERQWEFGEIIKAEFHGGTCEKLDKSLLSDNFVLK